MTFQLFRKARGGSGFSIYATEAVIASINELDADDYNKIDHLFDFIAEEGIPKNREKSKKLVDDIFELKSYQIRLAYIYGNNRSIRIFYHLTKKQHDWPKSDLKVVKQLRNDFE